MRWWPFASTSADRPRTLKSEPPEKPNRAKSHAHSSKEKLKPPKVSYYTFETSAKNVYRRRRKICGPGLPWTQLVSEEAASHFIRTTPIRDANQSFAQSRFRFLVVQYSDMKLLYQQKSLLEAAKAAGWISTLFQTFMDNHTTGSVVREYSTGLNFLAQTPHDDEFPFFSVSLSAHHGYGYENAPDWTALIFLGSSQRYKFDMDILLGLLDHELYPDDFPASLSPDLMILAVAFMRYQVNEIANGVTKMRGEILNVDDNLLDPTMYMMKRLRQIKTRLFGLRRLQGALDQRHRFAVELAATLEKTFETLRKRGKDELEGSSTEYSAALKDAVQGLSFILETLKHEVAVASPRIEAQQTMLDGQTNIMIANNSYRVADEARRDSASMKTIAVVTLAFLPGTFVAAVFSMSMFKWIPDSDSSSNDGGTQKNGSEQIVSDWLWLYWAITAPLTFVILALWFWWFWWTNKRYEEKQKQMLDEEAKME